MDEINAYSYWRNSYAWGICIIEFIFYFFIQLNGIRFVDKSRLNGKAKYRFELWFSSQFPKEKADEVKQSYGKEYGCSGIVYKSI